MSKLKVVLFCSRNKDNKHLPHFKERKVSFLSSKSIEDLMSDFNSFASKGLIDEMSRFYISVNSRDNNKIRKALLHDLIDKEDSDMSKVEQRIASIASKKENAYENKWLFDFDEDDSMIGEFLDDVRGYLPNDVETTLHVTPNGHAIVVDRGFDTRELLAKWKNVELKRDDMLCVSWTTKVREEATIK